MIVHYDESILSSVAAIRSYFGLSSSYAPEKRLSALLAAKKPQRIFLILIDAMGANMIQRKLPDTAFLNRQMLYKTMTVFPPTTVAATTSIQNGKAPNENAWLGWVQYMEEFDDDVIPFLGKGVDSHISYGEHVAYEAFPVKFTDQELAEKGIPARRLFPAFAPDGCQTLSEMVDRLIAYSQNKEYSYIYAYWDEYDSLLHKYGVDSAEADALLVRINAELERLSENLDEDTMMIVVADHGQIDMKEEINLAHSKYASVFSHRPCIEPRAQAFYIKEEFREWFEKEFKKDFSEYYVLLTKQQVLESQLFGYRENHPRLEGLLGDYLAIAKGDRFFSYNPQVEKENIFKGHHAGMHRDELTIPLIVYMKDL